MAEAPDRQRVDRWLWHARLVRTRGAAAALAGAGHVRVNGQRIGAPGRMVRRGDVLTIALDRGVRVVKVTGFRQYRGPAGSAAPLYEELIGAAGRPARQSPAESQALAPAARRAGS